jgi:hypothetical protein
MFEDLYDSVRMLFSWWWPTADAEISEVTIERVGDPTDNRLRLSVCYKFYVGDDGPYTGESFWQPKFTFRLVAQMRDARRTMRQKHRVPVRYRADDPSQNRLGREAWRGV